MWIGCRNKKVMMEILSQREAFPSTDEGPGGVGCALENIHSFPRILVNH